MAGSYFLVVAIARTAVRLIERDGQGDGAGANRPALHRAFREQRRAVASLLAQRPCAGPCCGSG